MNGLILLHGVATNFNKLFYINQVAVEGHHFCEFRHRIPITKVDTVHVHGSVRLSRIDVQVANVYPSFPPPLSTPSDSFDVTDPVTYLLAIVIIQLGTFGLDLVGLAIHIALERGAPSWRRSSGSRESETFSKQVKPIITSIL